MGPTDHLALDDLLDWHRDDRLVVIEPGGNHGDRLIYEGLEKRLDELGLAYRALRTIDRGPHPRTRLDEVRRTGRVIRKRFVKHALHVPYVLKAFFSVSPPDAVVLQGGGNLNDWDDNYRLFKGLLRHTDEVPVIVAPASYWFVRRDVSKLLEGADQPIHLFCRERYSSALLENKSLPTNVHVHVSPDTAFYLDSSDLADHCVDDLRPAGPDYDLVAFREGRERLVPSRRKREILEGGRPSVVGDISRKSRYSFGEFVSLAAGAKRVYTDRLHVSILSHLFGTETHLFENIYFKNRGVYKLSLADDDDVRFYDAVE